MRERRGFRRFGWFGVVLGGKCCRHFRLFGSLFVSGRLDVLNDVVDTVSDGRKLLPDLALGPLQLLLGGRGRLLR